MARWSELNETWIFTKSAINDNSRFPKRSYSSLEYLNPGLKWVITYEQDGHLEFFENWDGIAEYDSQQEAASVIPDAQAEYLSATNWRIIRHPLN